MTDKYTEKVNAFMEGAKKYQTTPLPMVMNYKEETSGWSIKAALTGFEEAKGALEKTLYLVGIMHSRYPDDRIAGGGWIYNWDTEKYVSRVGTWVNDVDPVIRIPNEELQSAADMVRSVCPGDRIMVITPDK